MSVADHRALPVAVSQGIWISRNNIIFEAKAYSPVELFKFHKINYVYDQVRKLPQSKASEIAPEKYTGKSAIVHRSSVCVDLED